MIPESIREEIKVLRDKIIRLSDECDAEAQYPTGDCLRDCAQKMNDAIDKIEN